MPPDSPIVAALLIGGAVLGMVAVPVGVIALYRGARRALSDRRAARARARLYVVGGYRR